MLVLGCWKPSERRQGQALCITSSSSFYPSLRDTKLLCGCGLQTQLQAFYRLVCVCSLTVGFSELIERCCCSSGPHVCFLGRCSAKALARDTAQAAARQSLAECKTGQEVCSRFGLPLFMHTLCTGFAKCVSSSCIKGSTPTCARMCAAGVQGGVCACLLRGPVLTVRGGARGLDIARCGL